MITRYVITDSVKEITELLHSAFAVERIRFVASNQNRLVTFYMLINGKSYLMKIDNKIIATITIKNYLQMNIILINLQFILIIRNEDTEVNS